MVSILICGGGNAAQAYACLCSSRYKVVAMLLRGEEARKWDENLQAKGAMECTMKQQGKVVRGMPDLITKDPSAVKQCDLVLCAVPSANHAEYFTALEPHVKPGTIFCVMPARSGVDFLFAKVMGTEKAATLGLVAFETLPWACQINEWGRSVTVLGTKDSVGVAVVPPAGKTSAEVILKVQGVLGVESMMQEYPNVMSISLANPGQVMHPGIMYSRWKGWDGQPMAKKPLFYHGADDRCAGILNDMSAEIQCICKALRALNGRFDTSRVKTIFEWYLESYASACRDTSTLQRALVTNSYYKDFFHPMKVTEETKALAPEKHMFLPDFSFRYIAEDVPTGLVFTKGVADLLGIDTPTMNMVLKWCQKVLGKEFILPNGLIGGKDVKDTRAPQAFGVTTTKELVEFLKLGPPPPSQEPSKASCFAGVTRICGSARS